MRELARLVAGEAFAFGFGVLMGAPPWLVVWLLIAPMAFFAWDFFSGKRSRRAFVLRPLLKYSWASSLAESKHRLGLVLAVIFLWISLSPLGEAIENQFWRTGRFGEPPDNRVVIFRRAMDSNGQSHGMAEFRPGFVGIDDFAVKLIFKEYQPSVTSRPYWIAESDLKIADKRLYGRGVTAGITGRLMPPRMITHVGTTDSIDLGESFYVDLGTRRRTIIGCFFGTSSLRRIDRYRCGESVEIRMDDGAKEFIVLDLEP